MRKNSRICEVLSVKADHNIMYFWIRGQRRLHFSRYATTKSIRKTNACLARLNRSRARVTMHEYHRKQAFPRKNHRQVREEENPQLTLPQAGAREDRGAKPVDHEANPIKEEHVQCKEMVKITHESGKKHQPNLGVSVQKLPLHANQSQCMVWAMQFWMTDGNFFSKSRVENRSVSKSRQQEALPYSSPHKYGDEYYLVEAFLKSE